MDLLLRSCYVEEQSSFEWHIVWMFLQAQVLVETMVHTDNQKEMLYISNMLQNS